MTESFPDDQYEVQRVFLWDDIAGTEGIFTANAFIVGLHASFEDPFGDNEETTSMFLQSKPIEDYTPILRAEVSTQRLIGSVVLLYLDAEGEEAYKYEITPNGITDLFNEPEPVGIETIEAIREDLSQAEWDPEASEEYAKNPISS